MQACAEELKIGIEAIRPLAIGVLDIKAKLGELMPAKSRTESRAMKGKRTCKGREETCTRLIQEDASWADEDIHGLQHDVPDLELPCDDVRRCWVSSMPMSSGRNARRNILEIRAPRRVGWRVVLVEAKSFQENDKMRRSVVTVMLRIRKG